MRAKGREAELDLELLRVAIAAQPRVVQVRQPGVRRVPRAAAAQPRPTPVTRECRGHVPPPPVSSWPRPDNAKPPDRAARWLGIYGRHLCARIVAAAAAAADLPSMSCLLAGPSGSA